MNSEGGGPRSFVDLRALQRLASCANTRVRRALAEHI
nr:MAG TPA: hypothetical protein [Caudoviricetes sp.]